MLLTRAEMQHVEQATFSRGIPADVLMETIGAKLARFVTQFFPRPGLVVCYAGKGHNAGDAFVAARHLAMLGWRVLVRTPFREEEFAPLTRDKFDVLHSSVLRDPFHPSTPQDSPGDPCVEADFTATVGFAKTGLVADAAVNHVGRLGLLDSPDFLRPETGNAGELLTAPMLRRHWPPRAFDTNKGMCGRAVLLAGSRGTLGAAHLCAAGAVRGGAGLVSLGALPDVYDLLAVTMIPEVMVRPLTKLTDIFNFPVDAIGIGPGLGSGQEARTLRVVREAPCPAVVDADALTVIAHAGLQHVDQAKGPRLLTPHPGEMQRLLAGRKISNRGQVARDFTDKHAITLLLKGARTVIAQRGLPLRYNTTGHPGMATGGMGDVLTGLCTALLAQGADTYQAASIGAWVCGRAAEIAVVQGASTESLTPSDVLEKLGSAFRSLRAGDF